MRGQPLARCLVVVAVLLVSACGDDGGDDGTAGVTTSTSTTTSTTIASTTTTESPVRQCSAAELDAELSEQPELPDAVAATRRRIAEAAVACDYEALERLTAEGDEPFTYSFGQSGDPAAFWQRREEGPGEKPGPLHFLVEVLDRPHGVIEHHGTVRYTWPSAFAYDSWAEVPEPEKRALEPLYDESDFEFFERFGGYVGYRVVILADGTWSVFVAGD